MEQEQLDAKVSANTSNAGSPSPSSALPGASAPRLAPGTQLVVYATVPAGVRPGEALGVETAGGKVLTAIVPDGCHPGDVFGVVDDSEEPRATASQAAESTTPSSPAAQTARST